jgi:hypothetical protein
VRECRQFVEELVRVAAAHDFDHAVFGCCSDDAGTDVFGSGGALAVDVVAA